jgi:chromosome partitioning protein
MKTITIAIQKGGTGKTCSAVSLARSLSDCGKTLLIDGDVQGNATTWLITEDLPGELALVLSGKMELEKAIIPTGHEGLFILPTANMGGGLNQYKLKTDQVEQMGGMADIINAAKKRSYDFLVIDLGPRFEYLEQGAYMASDEIITVIDPEGAAVLGLEIFSENLKSIQKTIARFPGAKTGRYNKMIINKINRSIKQHIDVAAQFKGQDVYKTYEVPQEPAYRKAWLEHKAVQDSGAKKQTVDAFSKLAKDIREGK